MKLLYLLFILLFSVYNLSAQLNYNTNSVDSVLLNDTIQFWGSQVEHQYNEQGQYISGQTVYGGISIFTKDSIHYFVLNYGYSASVQYDIHSDTIIYKNESREVFNIVNDTTMYLIDYEDNKIVEYKLMTLPKEFFLNMYKSKAEDGRMELSKEKSDQIDGLLFDWVKIIEPPKWPESCAKKKRK